MMSVDLGIHPVLLPPSLEGPEPVPKSLSAATRAIMVRVFPNPIGSAIMPPRRGGGSSLWYVSSIRLRKLD